MSIIETAAESAAKATTGTSALPWVLLGAVALLVATAAGAFYAGHHVEALTFDAYKSAQAAAASKLVADNRSALLKQQQSAQVQMDQVNQTFRGELNEITQRRDTLLAANRSLTERVRSAGTASRTSPSVPNPAASEPGADAAGYGSLSIGFAKLVDEFTDADRDAATVTALQQIVLQDRQTCNGVLPGAAAEK